MAKTKIEVDLVIKGGDSVGQVETKVVSLKKQLKDLKTQLASGELTGAAFDAAAKKAGELQDRIGDVNQRVKNLASDSQKLDGFVSLTQGIVGGFAAVQGITALVGDENEELQKTMVKLQGAMAALSGIQAVANTLNKDSAALTAISTIKTNAASVAQGVYTFAVGSSTGALKAFRIALLATGIGAIIVLLGYAASKMGLFGDATDDTTESLKKQKEATEALNNKFKDSDNLLLERYQQERDIAKARLKLAGATDAELLAQDRNFLLQKKGLLELQVQETKGQGESEVKALAELNAVKNEILLSELSAEQAQLDAKKKKSEERIKLTESEKSKNEKNNEDLRKYFAEQKAILDEANKIIAEANLTAREKEYRAIDEDFKNKIAQVEVGSQQETALREAWYIKRQELSKKFADEDLALAKTEQEKLDAQELAARNKRITDFENEQAAKQSIATSGYSILNSLGELALGNQYKQSALGKTLALAQIATDTAIAISSAGVAAAKASAATGNPLSGVAVYATTAAQVFANALRAKQILSGANAGAGGVTGSGGAGAATPPTVQGFVPQDSNNRADTKVYVLEKDITDVQGRVARIKSNAELI